MHQLISQYKKEVHKKSSTGLVSIWGTVEILRQWQLAYIQLKKIIFSETVRSCQFSLGNIASLHEPGKGKEIARIQLNSVQRKLKQKMHKQQESNLGLGVMFCSVNSKANRMSPSYQTKSKPTECVCQLTLTVLVFKYSMIPYLA